MRSIDADCVRILGRLEESVSVVRFPKRRDSELRDLIYGRMPWLGVRILNGFRKRRECDPLKIQELTFR
jgi:hypothetical protein